MISAKSAEQVKITTNYREGLGLSQRQLSKDLRGRWDATLVAGTDFSTTGTGDIIVYIYIDEVNVKNWTIIEKEYTRIFDIPSVDTNTVVVASAVGLVFASGVIGLLFTSISAGFTVFMVGGILLSLVNTSFLYLSLVGILFFGLKLMRRFISE